MKIKFHNRLQEKLKIEKFVSSTTRIFSKKNWRKLPLLHLNEGMTLFIESTVREPLLQNMTEIHNVIAKIPCFV